jgi:hypothetical protein
LSCYNDPALANPADNAKSAAHLIFNVATWTRNLVLTLCEEQIRMVWEAKGQHALMALSKQFMDGSNYSPIMRSNGPGHPSRRPIQSLNCS